MAATSTRGVRNLEISAARHDVIPAQPTRHLDAPTSDLMSHLVESISLERA